MGVRILGCQLATVILVVVAGILCIAGAASVNQGWFSTTHCKMGTTLCCCRKDGLPCRSYDRDPGETLFKSGQNVKGAGGWMIAADVFTIIFILLGLIVNVPKAFGIFFKCNGEQKKTMSLIAAIAYTVAAVIDFLGVAVFIVVAYAEFDPPSSLSKDQHMAVGGANVVQWVSIGLLVVAAIIQYLAIFLPGCECTCNCCKGKS